MASKALTFEFIKDRAPKIIMPWDVHDDINRIIRTTSDEIGWIGECTREGDVYTIHKVTIPKQEVHGATTEILDKGLEQIMETNELDITKWRYWGHSHPKFGVSPSAQDDSQMKEFADSCDWFVGSIHNLAGDIHGYIVDNELGVYYNNVPIEITYPERENVPDWKGVFKDRVSKLTTWNNHRKNGSYGHGSYYGYGGYNGYHRGTTTKKGDTTYYDRPVTGGKTASLPAGKKKAGSKGDSKGEKQNEQPPVKNISSTEWADFFSSEIAVDKKGVARLKGEIITVNEWEDWRQYYNLQHESLTGKPLFNDV